MGDLYFLLTKYIFTLQDFRNSSYGIQSNRRRFFFTVESNAKNVVDYCREHRNDCFPKDKIFMNP